MTRRRSRAIVVGLVLLALASVSIECGRTLHIVDVYGAPVQDVLVVYHHEGDRPNPAHTTTYEASAQSLVQGSSAGRVEIPLSAHVHWPFPIETHPRLRVDLVYAPTLHNGLATIGSMPPTPQPGVVVIAGDLANVTLGDLSGRPELWECTLRNVSWIIGQLIDDRTSRRARRRARPETPALTRVFIGHFTREYSAFLERYGDVARPRPEMPNGVRLGSTEAEQRAWEKMVDQDLAREPRWGDVAQRLFARDVERFAGEPSSTKP